MNHIDEEKTATKKSLSHEVLIYSTIPRFFGHRRLRQSSRRLAVRRFAISGGTARCPRAISSFGAGRRHVSPRGEKERGDVALVTFIEWYRGILTHTELYPKFAILTLTARYERYIPVCQVAGTRIARYRVVPPKIDRQRSIEGRNRPSAVD
ncbi:hypothetical protein B296_00041361 [Ensete ventricosum]|uniref:Uncharacterized protein n=1 Tax=Ensete ventricosum TaxID=4639 RepID=A0A426YLP4_ENSVE|nr:hypothetical protein B296_00041361 [Ensete ventricosum]